MDRLVLVVVLGALAVGVALLLRSRARTDAPTRPTWAVPGQVDRADLPRPDAPWLVAVFSSSTCTACRATWEKARQLSPVETQSVAKLQGLLSSGAITQAWLPLSTTGPDHGIFPITNASSTITRRSTGTWSLSR